MVYGLTISENVKEYFRLQEEWKKQEQEQEQEKSKRRRQRNTRKQKQMILDIDAQTIKDGLEFGIHQEPSIKFKQHQECKLFRCLECWLLIHPDDEITPFKEGFVHKLCSRLE